MLMLSFERFFIEDFPKSVSNFMIHAMQKTSKRKTIILNLPLLKYLPTPFYVFQERNTSQIGICTEYLSSQNTIKREIFCLAEVSPISKMQRLGEVCTLYLISFSYMNHGNEGCSSQSTRPNVDTYSNWVMSPGQFILQQAVLFPLLQLKTTMKF